MEKQKELSQDDAKKTLDKIQKETDSKIVEVDKLLEVKEKEVMTV